jgi:PST family polysaccharide transporter
MMVVARIIAPDELGVYAIAIAVYGFIVCVGALGVGAAIGRLDLDVDKLAPTVTTLAAVGGCATAALMAVLAGPFASALGVPEAAGAIRILAIAVALQGLFVVPTGQNQREFRQSVVFRGNAIGLVGSSATLLILVHVIPGAEAFAWSRVVAHLIACLTVLLSLDKRYRPGWNAEYVMPLLRFGVPAALGWLLAELVLNIDYVIIGREMSTADLGEYMLAFNIASWPTAVLGAVVAQIVLPAFSTVRLGGGDLGLTVSRAIRNVGFVACPIAAFTCAFAYPLIETVYGARWLGAAPVLRLLALYGVLYVLGLLFDNIMVAAGKTFAMFAVQVAALVALVPALLVGVHMGGLVGVGIGHIVVVLVVTMPVYLVATYRVAGAGVGVALRAISRPGLAAVAAAGVALLATDQLSSPIAKLAVAGVVGAIVYAAVVGPQLLELLPSRLAGKRICVVATTWPSLLAKQLRSKETRRRGLTATGEDGG